MEVSNMTDLRPAPKGHPIKLVRDNTPVIVNASGNPGDLFYGPVNPEEREKWLKLKLAEEVGEFLVDGGSDELLDVYAVLEGLAFWWGINLTTEHDERGGFLNGVMMYGKHAEFDR
jgi:predicted house-cleaning noncanonical NTP pyrophosphatase (MazG superfamily)